MEICVIKIYKDKEWLYNQYITLKKSTVKISRELNCSTETIRSWLEKFEINRRTQKKYPLINNKEWLYHQYIVLNKSTLKIAKENNCDDETIRRWLIKFSMPRRQKRNVNIACKELEKMYLQDKLSIGQIAKKLNCGKTTICRKLKKCDITRRSVIESLPRGEKSDQWGGGLFDRKRIDKQKWRNFRKYIIETRGRKCELCGKIEGRMNCAHIVHPEIDPELEFFESNILVLCNSCHGRLDNTSKRYRNRIRRGITSNYLL